MDIPETDSEDEMPPGWEERCTNDGHVFYANHQTKTTQWTHPRTGKRKKVTGDLPLGWERRVNPDGGVVFLDHTNNKTAFIDPRIAFAVEDQESKRDFRQRFDASSTGTSVLHGVDLSGKIAVVTGANSGIGKETARCLAHHGCAVILACRDVATADDVIVEFKKERPNCLCYSLKVDLASLKSVKTLAKNVKEKFGKCDLLILNAGIFGHSYKRTEDDLELTFQVNFLSHFYLALLLQPLLSLSSLGRVVFVSSESHRFSTFVQPSDISLRTLSPSQSQFYPTIAYNNSKLCGVLGAFELHRRFDERGLKCFAVHPGNLVSTNLSRSWWIYKLLFSAVRLFTKSLQQACAPILLCAVSSDLEKCGGMYINNCAPCLPSTNALDPLLCNALWNVSLKIIERRLGKKAFLI